MATPTRSQNVSTPKNALTSTPSNRINASPRTSSGAFNRTIAYKSPAVKTPHSHRTSQPMTSTPLAGSMLPDDILNLNSPSAAALILGGQTGLTPLTGAQDGLGISNGIGPSRDGLATRDLQVERTRRLQEVAQTLKKRATARNVTRENVEMLAQVHGFDSLWDGNALQLAGSKAVDLEIMFDGDERDKVVKSTLKLNLPDEEGALQADASAVLTASLMEGDVEGSSVPWKSLDPFASNLSYLDRMEHVDSTADCFDLVDGLYGAFQKIWDEEKKRMKWRHDAHHESQGNIGRPSKDTDHKLGVRSRYWTTGQNIYSASERPSSKQEWVAEFSCDKGQPSIPSRQDWLADEVLLNTLTAENIFRDSQVDKPNWQNPGADRKGTDAMNLDEEPLPTITMLDVRFVCNLDPAVLLPMHVANSFNAQVPMIALDQSGVSTFTQALKHDANEMGLPQDAVTASDESWLRTVDVFDESGKHSERKHSYHFYINGNAWAYRASRLHFLHPRQFAEVLPILRQYALVETLLRSITPDGTAEPSQQPTTSKKQLTKRSNKVAAHEKLNSVLGSTSPKQGSALPIDVRLDAVSDPTKAKIECRVPLSRDLVASKSRPFLSFVIEVRPNGLLEVVNMQGVESSVKDSLAKKLGRVVGVCEDIGMSLQWLLNQLKK